MTDRECPHCGESFPSACPHFHQHGLTPASRPCVEFWERVSGYDPDRKHDEQRDEPTHD